MQNTQLEVGAMERLRAELEALPGVQRAFVDGSPVQVTLICTPGPAPARFQDGAEAVLAEHGLTPSEVGVQVAYAGGSGQRRVKFVEAQLTRPRVGLSQARVTLEWNDQQFHGEADGEGGLPVELRVAARATVHALEAVLEGAVRLELVGIKFTRVFDHDLVAALVHCPEAPDRRLIGVAVVDGDAERTAALAVLNATNRLLGNYLAVGE